MKKYILLAMLFCFSVTSVLLDVFAGQASEVVGYIKETDGGYTLKRKRKIITPDNNGVCNGDVIIPQKKVTIIYRDTACGEVVIEKETTIRCEVKKEKPGWIKDFFANLMEVIEKRVIRKPLDPSNTGPHRNEGSTTKRDKSSCFPDNELSLISSFPPNGTTVMYGEAVCFRWDNYYSEYTPCEMVKLVILPTAGTKAQSVPPQDIKVSEFLCVDGIFQAGASYDWHVEKRDGNKISDSYHFSVLSKEKTQEIRSQLREIADASPNKCSDSEQALYLQILSDFTPGLDLYADSLRLLYKNKHSVRNEAIGRIFTHISKD